MADLTLAAWLGVLVGGLVATLWPYYNVLQATPGARFDRAYVISLAFSVLIAMPSSLVAYALIVAAIPASLAAYADSAWFVFAFGALIGSGANRLLNEHVVDKAKGAPNELRARVSSGSARARSCGAASSSGTRAEAFSPAAACSARSWSGSTSSARSGRSS